MEGTKRHGSQSKEENRSGLPQKKCQRPKTKCAADREKRSKQHANVEGRDWAWDEPASRGEGQQLDAAVFLGGGRIKERPSEKKKRGCWGVVGSLISLKTTAQSISNGSSHSDERKFFLHLGGEKLLSPKSTKRKRRRGMRLLWEGGESRSANRLPHYGFADTWALERGSKFAKEKGRRTSRQMVTDCRLSRRGPTFSPRLRELAQYQGKESIRRRAAFRARLWERNWKSKHYHSSLLVRQKKGKRWEDVFKR